jgi:peptidoglycan/xylan/chitin deacetylase (PgdA/CDA1 family)
MTKTLVSFTLDNLGDAADLYRGNIVAPRPKGANYALETGVPALLEMYARHRIPLTYFVEGWSADHYPDLVRDFASRGIHIGMHGWQHEIWHLLDDAEAEELLLRAHKSLTATLGQAPTTFRAPGGKTTAHTQKVLAQLGYRVDASYQDSAQPSRAAGELVNVPYQWQGVDATHWLWHKRSPAEALAQWRQAIEQSVLAATPLVFIFHSHVMGMQNERIAAGNDLIETVLADERLQVVPLTAIRETIA